MVEHVRRSRFVSGDQSAKKSDQGTQRWSSTVTRVTTGFKDDRNQEKKIKKRSK